MERIFCASKTAPIVETPKGRIRGFHFDGVDHFYGIRYAKAKRFHMPEPVPAWEGVKDADSYGMICPVLENPQPKWEVLTPHRFWPASEHCQYLNIWTASCDPAAKRPVMFWIHGGGYAAGSSIEQVAYDGFNLAKLDDVVVVTVNHRLNAFGYLDLSAFGPQYANSVNAGQADLVEALRWVRDNIACFGGDPDNVTIFGQSGGGGKVTVLGQTPAAEGLFHKMIVMSGVITDDLISPGVPGEELVKAILGKLHIPAAQVEKLEKVPAQAFIQAVNAAVRDFAAQGRIVNWVPRPNDFYTCDPLQGDFSEASLQVPTIVGSVIAEFAFATKDYGDRDALTPAQREQAVLDLYGEAGGRQILKAWREAFPGKNEVYATEYDTVFLPPTLAYAKKKAAHGKAPVYNYLFSKVYDYDGGKAAWHCADIPYFFHNAALIPISHQPNGEKLNRLMSGAFVNFARTGDPNGGDLPLWPPCTGEKVVTMVMDDAFRAVEDLHEPLLPLILQHKPKPQPAPPAPAAEDEEEGSAWFF